MRIKVIRDLARDKYFSRRLLREISINVEASRNKRQNPFCAHTRDIIMPKVNDRDTVLAKEKAHKERRFDEDFNTKISWKDKLRSAPQMDDADRERRKKNH